MGRDKKKNSTGVPRVEIANEYSSNSIFCVMILSSKKNPLSTEWDWNYVALRTGSWLFLLPQLLHINPSLPVAPPFLSLVRGLFYWGLLKASHPCMTSLDNPPNVNIPWAVPCEITCCSMSMFYLAWWKWEHLTWWGDHVAEGLEHCWLNGKWSILENIGGAEHVFNRSK